jgi:hypothetical protein
MDKVWFHKFHWASFSKALGDNTQNVKSIWFFVIFIWGRCTNEWFIFVAFSSFCNTHLVLLSPSKTYSAKFFNWDLVLDYQLDYENICTIISWKQFPHFYLWTFETKNKDWLVDWRFIKLWCDIKFQSKWFGMTKYVKFYYLKNLYLKTLSWKL